MRVAGWRVLVIRECALRGLGKLDDTPIPDNAARFIQAAGQVLLEITLAQAGSAEPH